MRAEIHAKIGNHYSYVLWDNKAPPPLLSKLGCLSGYLHECVYQGSMRKGLPVNEDGNEITHEENDWAITPTTVYIPGRVSDDNLHTLVELSEKKSKVD